MTQTTPPQPAEADPAAQARRAQKLARIAEAHDEWVAEWADKAPFDPDGVEKYGEDYPLFHVDLDATPEMAADLARRYAEVEAAFET